MTARQGIGGRPAQSLRPESLDLNALRTVGENHARTAARGLLVHDAMARRSLFPREHGAYVQLAIPLTAAFLVDGIRPASALLGGAACLAFLAHEPLLVLLGVRGPRMRQTEGRRARTRLAALGAAAILAGVIGLALAPRASLPIAAAGGVLSIVLIGLARRRREHTVGGELLAATVLSGASAIVRVAAGAAPTLAISWWLGWSIGFGATVIAVHRVLARNKTSASAVDALLSAGGVASSLVTAILAPGHLTFSLAAPLVIASTVIVVVPPRATRLRTVGIAFSVVAALAGVLGALV